jgi:hypothetical protein
LKPPRAFVLLPLWEKVALRAAQRRMRGVSADLAGVGTVTPHTVSLRSTTFFPKGRRTCV